jgi:hypothetical protein
MLQEPRFRVVGPEDGIRRRRPGAAFLSVCLYAALFGGALWYLGARTGIWKKNVPAGRSASPAPVVPASVSSGQGDGETGGESGRGDAGTRGRGANALSRDALLAGQGIAEPARSRYFSRLATERCDCGCARTLSDCLVNEKTCSRSPELANRVRQSAR